MRAFTGAFLIGLFQWPMKVHFFPCASHVPSATSRPVDIESFQVDQYLPVMLSQPIMPRPLNGEPIIDELSSSRSTRPSSIIERLAVPVSSMAGAPASCHDLTLRS